MTRPWRFLLLAPLAVAAFALWAGSGEGSGAADRQAASTSRQSQTGEVACTRTLGGGADASAAIARARGGATICLEPGEHAEIAVSGVAKSPPVTVRSLSEERATVEGIALTDASGLRFVALDVDGGIAVSPGASRLQFAHNDITGPLGIYLFGDYRIGKRIDRVLIAGNRIHHIDYTGTQEAGYGYGIEGVGDARHVTVRGNTIESTASDYIQAASPVRWTVEGNTFLGPSLLGSHQDHQDLWQIFGGGRNVTFTNNVARNTQTQESLLFQEGAFSNVVVENNLFDHDSRGYTCQIYQSRGLVFRRNTIVGSRWGCLFRDDPSLPTGSDYRIARNIFVGTRDGADVGIEGRAGTWGSYDYNVSSDASAGGRHSLRNWRPSWRNRLDYVPGNLPFGAGYRP
jgi:nitrous oxidase accessory protein NosD